MLLVVKLIGAGGGGFLLFYSDSPAKLRNALKNTKLKEVRFKFDFEGRETNIVTNYQVLILIGGKGTRVKKFTKKNPKCLIKFNKKTLLILSAKILKK